MSSSTSRTMRTEHGFCRVVLFFLTILSLIRLPLRYIAIECFYHGIDTSEELTCHPTRDSHASLLMHVRSSTLALRNNDSIRQGITGHEDYRINFYVNASPNPPVGKHVYEVKEETWSSTTFLILASSSGLMLPIEISSRRGVCELVKCDLNSASHWVILSTGMESS